MISIDGGRLMVVAPPHEVGVHCACCELKTQCDMDRDCSSGLSVFASCSAKGGTIEGCAIQGFAA